MFIELKTFALPNGAAIRTHGRQVDDRSFGLLWDTEARVVWVIPRSSSEGPTRVYPVEGTEMQPKDPIGALETCGFKAKAKKASAAEKPAG